ncbi:MAG TPA: 3-oxoacyl-ACP reductase [Deltaproteobacteria bacterium]|nr:3-oxoacyl-ACP reductase [Deltaproteobacteria bacterium]HCP44733.1 3-oxoacyl-ACP reductase [Deltaproteobacteria bacterium]
MKFPSLQDRVVLVTGGGAGIGEALVEAFLEQGARVAFFDRAIEPSESLVDRLGGKPLFVPLDLTDVEAIRAGVTRVEEELGPVQVLVNNAGWDERCDIEDMTPEFWDLVQGINLKSYVFTTQAVLAGMKSTGSGSIINMGSTSWRLAIGGMPAYTSAKAGIEGLTRGLARDLGGHGIRANVILPGWVMTKRQRERWVTPEALAETLERQCVPLELQATDIAPTVLFLASDAARAVTAQSWCVDGGVT